MLLAPWMLAALVPMATPLPPEGAAMPAIQSLADAPTGPATATQHVVTKVVQVVGAEASGVAVGISGGFASLVPALVLSSMDSGNVAGGVLVFGAGAGYCVGASWAICKAALEINGTSGPMRETALGVGTGLVLVGAGLATGLVPVTEETVLAAALVPPLTGIAVFEMTKSGPAFRRATPDIPEHAYVVAAFGVAAAGWVTMRASADIQPAGRQRAILPLLQLRW